MREIIELDDALSNKIAAGEVVERPASVVKELVENSIDAGSSVIEIDVFEAGMEMIRVLDNGKGIGEEDAEAAFKRHATSKIKDENDLFRIRTLGFRGEALPSIASVSQLEMVTSDGQSAGTRLVLDGGKIVLKEKAGSRKGTDIKVSGLFFNTPARLKYMKSIHTELGNITDTVNRLALAHPEVSLRLRHNDRVLLHTSGNGDVRQVLAAIYGTSIARQMIPVSAQSLDFTLNGYMSLPEITRASRNYISTMINGRFIKNYPIVKAIQEGYHTLLPIGRYPIVLLDVVMDPILVDVNVHPSKLEVRLSKEKELNELVAAVIRNAFKKRELIPAGPTESKASKIWSEQTALRFADPEPERRTEAPAPAFSGPIREADPYDIQKAEPDSIAAGGAETFFPAEERAVAEPASHTDFRDFSETAEPRPDYGRIAEHEAERIPPLYPIGQMHGTYIFAQNERGLYIIDQHAAQERIKYEYFRDKVGEVPNELQEMLVPLTMEYSADEAVKIQEYEHELRKVGVFLEPFGQNSFIARAHPQWFPRGEEKQLIEEMIEQLLSMKTVDIRKLREEAAIMMSCKAAIKANRHLRTDEIQALLDELRRTSDPFTCPHGRPIIVHYSTYEMEKMFKRVM